MEGDGMIDIKNESIFPLKIAAQKSSALKGVLPNYSTLCKWCNSGLYGVRLEHVRVGRKICTSVEAIRRFVIKTTYAKTKRSANAKCRKQENYYNFVTSAKAFERCDDCGAQTAVSLLVDIGDGFVCVSCAEASGVCDE